jgi:hypothetical protein
MPSATVFQSTGSDCIAFAVKQGIKEHHNAERKNSGKTLNKQDLL